jgi:hypothetical protein
MRTSAKRAAACDVQRDAKQLVRAVEKLTLCDSDCELEFTRVPSKDYEDSDSGDDTLSQGSRRRAVSELSAGSVSRRRTYSEPFVSMQLDPEQALSMPRRIVQLKRDASRRLDEKVVSFATTKLTRHLSRRREALLAANTASPRNGYAAGCECDSDDAERTGACSTCALRRPNVASL